MSGHITTQMANEDLGTFLKQYGDLSEDELSGIVHSFRKRTLRKGEHLLSPGQHCRDIVFVREGCIRLYYLKDEIEVSVWFSFRRNSAIEITSFVSEKPTQYFLQAIEDTEILYLTKPRLTSLYKEYPRMEQLMRKFWEDVAINLIERFTSLQRDSAEDRYKELLRKPIYLQMVPQKYLASFIGVTPTSLSRIRRKIGSRH